MTLERISCLSCASWMSGYNVQNFWRLSCVPKKIPARWNTAQAQHGCLKLCPIQSFEVAQVHERCKMNCFAFLCLLDNLVFAWSHVKNHLSRTCHGFLEFHVFRVDFKNFCQLARVVELWFFLCPRLFLLWAEFTSTCLTKTSGHMYFGLDVAWNFVNLSPDHMYPWRGICFKRPNETGPWPWSFPITMNVPKIIHLTFLQYDQCRFGRLYRVNAVLWFLNMMTVSKASRETPEITLCFQVSLFSFFVLQNLVRPFLDFRTFSCRLHGTLAHGGMTKPLSLDTRTSCVLILLTSTSEASFSCNSSTSATRRSP